MTGALSGLGRQRFLRFLRISCGSIGLVLLGICVLGLIPNPPPTAPFHSGGLGLTRAEWQQRYQVSTTQDFHIPFTEPVYEDTDHRSLYSLAFWPEGWLNSGQARITAINPFGWGVSPDTPDLLIQQLIPDDSQSVRQHLAVPEAPETSADIYYSPSLATRYPPRPFVPDPWQGTKPGTFFVLRGNSLVITIPQSAYAPPRSLLAAR